MHSSINRYTGCFPIWKWKSFSHVRLFVTPWTIHGILQARRLEWVAFPFSRGSSQPRDWTQVSHIAGRFFTSWATREARFPIWATVNMLPPGRTAVAGMSMYWGGACGIAMLETPGQDIWSSSGCGPWGLRPSCARATLVGWLELKWA